MLFSLTRWLKSIRGARRPVRSSMQATRLRVESLEDRVVPTATLPTVTGITGGNLPFDNMQPYTALNYCIAVQGIFPSRDLSSLPDLGAVELFAGNFAPRGWMFCAGQLLSISENTALFS